MIEETIKKIEALPNDHLSDTPEYRAFKGARARCQNPKHISYPRYGGRGIEFRFRSLTVRS
jgi:hypothetical protein